MDHPGSALLVVHHTRKLTSGDWMDSTSGTQGLNGSADFTIALERGRGDGSALLKVSGPRRGLRGEYAATMTDGCWVLDGDSPERSSAGQRATTGQPQNVGDQMADVIAAVGRHQGGVRAEGVAEALGIDKDSAGRYLRRAAEAGRVDACRSWPVQTSVRSVRSVRSRRGPSNRTGHNGHNGHRLGWRAAMKGHHAGRGAPGREAGGTSSRSGCWPVCSADPDRWFAESIDDRRAAAVECVGCPRAR